MHAKSDSWTVATAKQIRDHYVAQGCDVRLSSARVTFRRPGETWSEGRWLGEYDVDGNGNVYLR